MPHDLVIKDARVFDPGQGIDAVRDVAIASGRIAAIETAIPAEDALRVISARGANRYLVPGLIDIHTHVAYGAHTAGVNDRAIAPDTAGVLSGVTTIVDAGSTGAHGIGVFQAYILPPLATRTLCFVNLSGRGLSALHQRIPDVARMEDVDREAIAGAVRTNPGLIAGIKLRLVGSFVAEHGGELVRIAVGIARENDLPLMIHIGELHGESSAAPAVTRVVLETLGRGDIVTHACTDHSGSLLDPLGEPVPGLSEARARGVLFDCASGTTNFRHEVARRLLALGFPMDIISTDLTRTSRHRTVFALTESMAKVMAIGHTFADVVRMTTTNPARALRMSDRIGAIAVGREADLTLLDLVEGRWRFTDRGTETFEGRHAIVPVQTVRGGRLISPEWGPHPWGWLPEDASRGPSRM